MEPNKTKPLVYLETTIPSYLTARPTGNPLRSGQQELTREWWNGRDAFQLFVSRLVLDECGRGDQTMAAERISAIQGLPVLEVNELSIAFAEVLIRDIPLPPKAEADAVHISLSAVHGMGYLLTWNCAHIANATMRLRIEAACRKAGLQPPIICTPQELMPGEPS